MIDNINQTITPLTTFPDRPNYTSSSAYAEAVAIWLSEEGIYSGQIGDLVPKLNTMIDEINTASDAISASEAIIIGAANYKGDWVAGTYALSDSVSVGSDRYVSKIYGNTDTPPSSNWFLIPDSYSKAETDTKIADAIGAIPVPDGTLATFQRATVVDDTFSISYNKTSEAGTVALYKEVATEDEQNSIFNASAGTTGFNYDETKIESSVGEISLKSFDVPYGITSGVYENISFDISSIGDTLRAFRFNNDGTKLYFFCGRTGKIYQTNLSEAYNIASSSVIDIASSYYINTYDPASTDFRFNNDGSKLYTMGTSTDKVHQHSLTIAFDITTASYDNLSVSVIETQPSGFDFNNDGTKMYVVGNRDKCIYPFTLSTAYAINTATYDGVNRSISGETTYPYAIEFNNNGTEVYIAGTNENTVVKYPLATAYDISTLSYDVETFSIATEETQPNCITFNGDGTKLYVGGSASDKIHQYSIIELQYVADEYNPVIPKNSLDTSLWTAIDSLNVTSDGSVYYALSTDNKQTYQVLRGYAMRTIVRNNTGTWEYNSNVDFSLESWVSASVNTEAGALIDAMLIDSNRMDYKLGEISFDLNIASYANISFDYDDQTGYSYGMYMSPDGTILNITDSGGVYQYNLTTAFDVSTAVFSTYKDLTAQVSTLRGITFNDNGTRMFAVSQGNDTIYQYDTLGFDVSSASYASKSFSVATQESVPWCIAFNDIGSKMYILGGQKTVFQYRLTNEFDVNTSVYDGVSFSVGTEVSTAYGISFNQNGTKMFILCGTTDSVYSYTLSTPYAVNTASYDSISFSVTTEEPSPRSMSCSADGTRMYIAGDADFVLQYKIGELTDPPLQDNLALTPILYTDTPTITPTYTGAIIQYDAFGEYQLLQPTIDYNVKLGTDALTIKSNVDGNIKGRIV